MYGSGMSEPGRERFVVTKVGCGYRCEWDRQVDELRVFVEGSLEPAHWTSLGRHGLEAGTLEPMTRALPDSPEAESDDSRRGPVLVSLRMTSASHRPSITYEEALALTGVLPVTLLNMLRHGHDGLLALPGVEKPLTVREAGELLAEACRGGLFGCTRDIERRVGAAGFEDGREWVEDRLEKWDRAVRLAGV